MMTKTLSQTFTWLRLPMIIGVMFIHIYATQWEVAGVADLHTTSTSIFDVLRNLVSRVLASTAVPIFFLMSGFLFFKAETFDAQVFRKNIKSRVRTLLIPYFSWNGLILLLYVIAVHLPVVGNYVGGSSPIANDPSTSNYLNALIGFKPGADGMYMPIVAQFWFIRDLFILCLLSPLFYLLVNHTQSCGIAILALLWASGISWFTKPYFEASLFFAAGAYFRYHHTNVLESFQTKISKVSLLYPLFVIADTATKGMAINLCLHNVGVILGMIFIFNTISYLIGKGKLIVSPSMAAMSFFVFAIHEPMQSIIRKVFYAVLQPDNQWLYMAIYFLSIIITFTIAVTIYKIGNRMSPRFMRIIDGGR